MKKKLITLLVTLMVIGLQLIAQERIVTIFTGADEPAAPIVPNNGTLPLDNERGGYAGRITELPNKLTVNSDGEFVYAPGPPNPALGSPDRITISNPSVNFVSFSQGTNKLVLKDPGGVSHDQFVVFMASGNDRRVPQYYNPDVAAPATHPNQVITPQVVTSSYFEGFLAIQAGGMVDDSNLLIVVHDKDGVLYLMPYGDYVDSLNGDLTLKDNDYYPLFIKTEPLSGRWARPTDFKDCKFNQFYIIDGDGNKTLLGAYDGDYLQNTVTDPDKTLYDVFTATQVDYVSDNLGADPGWGPPAWFVGGTWSGPNPAAPLAHRTNNIITHYQHTPGAPGAGGARFQGINRDFATTTWKGSQYYGTTHLDLGGGDIDSVIPLFVLGAAQQDNCKVLSVSRQNNLMQQSEQDMGFADQLELREYGAHYNWQTTPAPAKWVKSTATPSTLANQGDANDRLYDQYTSLQKFAIWIDDDGHFVLYPAAAYFWQYGEDKPTQADEILPNAVLIYNDINVRYSTGKPADKQWGLQIGLWNGNTTVGEKDGGITTIPNLLQTYTDYGLLPWTPDCYEEDIDLSGRFYFLQLYPDTAGAWNSALYGRAFNRNNYQFDRKYVLSAQLYELRKYPEAVIKEECRNDMNDIEKWRFPFDSVNMAAHWEIQKVLNAGGDFIGYRFINMLGDTLKMNPNPASWDTRAIWSGFSSHNHFLPGDPLGTAPIVAGEKKYFGRPADIGFDRDVPRHWFNYSTLSGYIDEGDVWMVHQMKGSNEFFLQMTNHSFTNYQISLNYLIEGFTAANSWYNVDAGHPERFMYGGPSPTAPTPPALAYYQKAIALNWYDATALVSYIDGGFSTCGGMKISKEPIPYVPTFGPFYPGDKTASTDNGIYNTNDETKPFLKQDSLTAYTFLTGNYDILEAREVMNGLKLSSENVPIYDGTGRTVDAAAFIATTDVNILEFIPLDSNLGRQRKDRIETLNTDAGFVTDAIDSIGFLYGETYKWYIVKSGNQYLTFDTLNASSTQNRTKVGFVFNELLENAVPIRLYQPLVGDKNKNNFLFQFYMPRYTYYSTGTVIENIFPDVDDATVGATVLGGRHVYFADLAGQSKYIYSTRVYGGTGSGTRFTFDAQVYACDCNGEFILPKWMAQERLLNMPLLNQVWVNKEPVTAWIAVGPKENGEDAAIITNESAEEATDLLHTYVTAISDYKDPVNSGYQSGKVYIPIPGSPNAATRAKATYETFTYGSFAKDTVVPLYNIQNNKGLYLTVAPLCELQNDFTTMQDVSGVKLQWQEKIEWNECVTDSLGYDPRALQLFAINGCMDPPINEWYGKFVYLPLASYIQDYKTGTLVKATRPAGAACWHTGSYEVLAVRFNIHLGHWKDDYGKNFNCEGSDISSAFRISQYTPVNKTIKDLVVFNSNGTEELGNFVPVEFKLKKQAYEIPDCDTYLVQNNYWRKYTNGLPVTNTLFKDYYNYYFTLNGFTPLSKLDVAPYTGEWKLNAHWNIVPDPNGDGDKDLAAFEPELKEVYGEDVETIADYPRDKLTGQYYFIKRLDDKSKEKFWKYMILDISGYEEENWAAVLDTISLRCVEHGVPYYDLNALDFDTDAQKLAILETAAIDRNLSTVASGIPMTDVYDKSSPPEFWGLQTFINKLPINDWSNAEYLTVYKQNRDELTPDHVIPYYSFSVTKIEGGKPVEYFLTVEPTPYAVGSTLSTSVSVYWKKLTDEEYDWLVLDPASCPNDEMNLFKFCLPYQLDEDGLYVDPVEYDNVLYQPVYLQTRGIEIDDYPYLVIAYSATSYTTHRWLPDAIDPRFEVDVPFGTPIDWNIYSMEYRDQTSIDVLKVTKWFFGGPIQQGLIWVPIQGLAYTGTPNETTKEGVITNQLIAGGGVTFIDQSNDDPTNFAIMTSVDISNLTLKYEGMFPEIGKIPREIWYYRIIVPDEDGEPLYLTDATVLTGEQFLYNGVDYDVAFFGPKEDEFADYADDEIYADETFSQTFGFKYFDTDQDPDQRFLIVSNADYTTPKAEKYRYLSEVKNQLVFVEKIDDALVFMWGTKDGDDFTNIEVVGKGGIYGVEGGIRLLNTTGKVDVYSIDGRLITSAVLNGNETTIPATRGVAIVKNGSKVVKVVVK